MKQKTHEAIGALLTCTHADALIFDLEPAVGSATFVEVCRDCGSTRLAGSRWRQPAGLRKLFLTLVDQSLLDADGPVAPPSGDPDDLAILQASALRAQGGEPEILIRYKDGKITSIDVLDTKTGKIVGENACRPMPMSAALVERMRVELQRVADAPRALRMLDGGKKDA